MAQLGHEKRKADLKVVILGDSAVGKTTLIHRYMEGVFTSKASTIGASFFLKQWGPYNVAIWDTAGEEKYAGLSSFYCRGASAAILAYDLSRHNSLNVLKDRHIPLLESAEDNCLCVLVGTKHDLVDENPPQVTKEVGETLARIQNTTTEERPAVPYFKTSSKTGENVEEVFTFILNSCLPLDDNRDKEERKSRKASNSCVDLDKPRHSQQRRKCC